MASPSLARCPHPPADLGLRIDGPQVSWVGPVASAADAPLVRWTVTDEAFAAAVAQAEPGALDGWVREVAMPRPLLDALAERCAERQPEAALRAARGQAFVDARWQASLATACLRAGQAEPESPTPGRLECLLDLPEGETLSAFRATERGAVAVIRRYVPEQPQVVSLCWIADGQAPRRQVFESLGHYTLPRPLLAPAGCLAVAGQYKGSLSLWVFDADGTLLAQGRWAGAHRYDPSSPFAFTWHEGALWLHSARGHFRLALVPERERSLNVEGPAGELLAKQTGYLAPPGPAVGCWVLVVTTMKGEPPRWLHLVTCEERPAAPAAATLLCYTPEGAVLTDDHTVWLSSPERPARRLVEGHFWRASWGRRLLWLDRYGDRSWLAIDRATLTEVADLAPSVLERDGWVLGEALSLDGGLLQRTHREADRSDWSRGVHDGDRQWIDWMNRLLVFEGEQLTCIRPFLSGSPIAARRGLALVGSGGLRAYDADGRLVHEQNQDFSLDGEQPQACVHDGGLWVQGPGQRSLWRWTVEPPPRRPVLFGPRTTEHRKQTIHGPQPDNHEPCCSGYYCVREDMLGLDSTYEGSDNYSVGPSVSVASGSLATLVGCTLQGPIEVFRGGTLILLDCVQSEHPDQIRPGGLVLRASSG